MSLHPPHAEDDESVEVLLPGDGAPAEGLLAEDNTCRLNFIEEKWVVHAKQYMVSVRSDDRLKGYGSIPGWMDSSTDATDVKSAFVLKLEQLPTAKYKLCPLIQFN